MWCFLIVGVFGVILGEFSGGHEEKIFAHNRIIWLKLLDFCMLCNYIMRKLVRTELEIICATVLVFRYTVSVNEGLEF
jgi:hypothetical protein